MLIGLSKADSLSFLPKPVNMRHYLRLLITAVILFSLLFTACRNAVVEDIAKETTVIVRMAGDPENLNFILTADSKATEIFRLISMPMASFDPSTLGLTPTLLKNMPIATEIIEGEYKGRIRYDFELLAEATWDDGSPITGEDLLFTLKTIFNPNYASPHRSFNSFIKHFVVDETNPKKFSIYGVKYIIAGPVIANLELMPKYVYDPKGLLDKYTLAELKDRNNVEKMAGDTILKAFADQFQSAYHLNNPLGISYAGPYKVENWTNGQEIVLIKKKNWWGEKLAAKTPLLMAKPNKIIFKFIPDINAALSLAKNGEVDVIGSIPWSEFANLKDDKLINDQFNLETPSIIVYRYIAFNTNNPKLEDKRVRKALDHLFDRDQIYNTVYYGNKNPVVGPIHPSKPYYNKGLKIRSFDVEKAKSLLKEAGWEDTDNNGIVDKMIDGEKVDMEFELIYASNYTDYVGLTNIFKGQAIKAGVKINTKTMNSQAYTAAYRARNFDAMINSSLWYPINKDLYSRYHTKGGQNYGSLSNPILDELITTIRFSTDEAELSENYLKAQAIIHDEAPNIFINTAIDRIIINKKFGKPRVTPVKPNYYVNEFVAKSVATTASKN